MKDIKLEVKEPAIHLSGEYVFTKARIETVQQRELYDKIEERRASGEDYIGLVRELNALCETEVLRVKNTITTVGLTMVANNLASVSPTNLMKFSHSALGAGTTSPTVSDTMLEDEQYRRQVASVSNNGKIVYVTAFYGASETSGLFTEHAIFSDGSLTENSGVMFSRVLLNNGSGVNKSTSETLTIDYTLTIS